MGLLGTIVTALRDLRSGCRRTEALPSSFEKMRDISEDDIKLIKSVMPFTMTSHERVFHLIQSIRYLEKNAIRGAIVECGVWRGGSMMTCANALMSLQSTSRDLYLFDTFDGMPPPEKVDELFDGEAANGVLEKTEKSTDSHYWAIAPLDEVRANLASTHYPGEKTHFVKGRVEETLPDAAPESIAMLRLDTDWYASTRHELEHLYPRLVRGGVLIIDDYGWWKGARKATDEYLRRLDVMPLLHRIDDAGARACIKP